MKRCETCRVDYSGDLETCLLCGSSLTGLGEPSPFVPSKAKEAGTFALALLAVVAVVAAVALTVLGDRAGFSAEAKVAGCAGVVLNYLFVRNIIKHSPAFLRSVVRYFLLVLAICTVWYLVTGSQDVVTYVIPGVCITSLVFNTVLVVAFRNAFVLDYAKYLLFNIVLGVVPLAFSLAGLTAEAAPSWISAAAALALSAALAVFARKQVAAEMGKLFSA